MSKKIAMWSGPRNLSTAMMYSFASRSDTSVVDEPFYAAYLAKTGLIHPMNAEVLAAGDTDANKVIDYCLGDNPESSSIFYQKHMTKHMISSFSRDWITELCNVFLIRDPGRVIASYHAKSEDPQLSDIGVKEQQELFDKVCQDTGQAPVVIDSADILENPALMIKKLCEAIGITYQEQMMNWQLGPKPYDGVWAPHWYKSVWKSTGFGVANRKVSVVPDHLQALLEEANEYYDKLKTHTLKV